MPNIEIHNLCDDLAKKLYLEILKILKQFYTYKVTFLLFPIQDENCKDKLMPYIRIKTIQQIPSIAILEKLYTKIRITMFADESSKEISISEGKFFELGKFIPKKEKANANNQSNRI